MIIGILAAIALPKYNDSVGRAKYARIVADLRTIEGAIMVYAAMHGRYPGYNDLDPKDGKVGILSAEGFKAVPAGSTVITPSGKTIKTAGNGYYNLYLTSKDGSTPPIVRINTNQGYKTRSQLEQL